MEPHGEQIDMIRSIEILNGFLTEMPGFYPGKRFDFDDGLTVLFGPNGVGKSSVIKMLKAYCGIERGGSSRISSPLTLGAQSKSHFPWVYRAYSPGQSDCRIDWDGVKQIVRYKAITRPKRALRRFLYETNR